MVSESQQFENLGFVHRYGVGIQTAQEELKASGNPPAEFILDGGSVLCKVYQVQLAGEVTAQVVEFCLEPKTAKEIMAKLGLKHWKSFQNNYLNPLLNAGIVERTIPDKPNSRLQKYQITAKGRVYIKPHNLVSERE